MSIDELNRRYGAPGRIVFHAGHAGQPNVVIANKYGTAEIALLGGNVLSYRPTGHSEVLFRPAKRDYNRGDSFHGGIPLCWPQFGNRSIPGLPQHGFARISIFTVRGTSYSEDMTEITLGLASDADTKALWPHDFNLELKVTVSMKLTLKLTTTNTGDAPFDFNAGFHPYLSVRDRDGVAVRGLDGATFVDARANADGVQTGDLAMNESRDHVFTLKPALKHELALLDPGLGRAIAVVSSGNANAVVWNPGPEGKLADFQDGDWRKFTCVEPVTAWPTPETLAPGAKHVFTCAIQSTLKQD